MEPSTAHAYNQAQRLYTMQYLTDRFNDPDVPIFFDTGALLEFYNIHPAPRRRMLAALKTIDSRLFLPSHTLVELLRNKDTAGFQYLESLQAPLKKFYGFLATIDSQLQTMIDAAIPDGAERDSETTAGFDQARKLIEEAGILVRDQAERAFGEQERVDELRSGQIEDDIFGGIIDLFRDENVSPLASEEAKEAALAQFQKRISQDPPLGPGKTDQAKDRSAFDGAAGAVGDYLIWLDILSQARRIAEGKGFFFVTQEKKEDYWVSSQKESAEGSLRKLDPRLQSEALEATGGPALLIDRNQLWKLLSSYNESEDFSKFESASAQWSEAAFEQLLSMLASGGHESHLRVINRAIREGGAITRAQIGEELGWGGEDRYLTKFSSPVLRIQSRLVESGVLPAAAPRALTAVYENGPGAATGYRVPDEFVTLAGYSPESD